MDMFFIAGSIGALLIICAWAFEAIQSVERHKSLMDLKFAAIYIVAMSMLVVHSLAIGDPVFIFLNVTILIIAAFEVIYTIHLHRRGKLKSRRCK